MRKTDTYFEGEWGPVVVSGASVENYQELMEYRRDSR